MAQDAVVVNNETEHTFEAIDMIFEETCTSMFPSNK